MQTSVKIESMKEYELYLKAQLKRVNSSFLREQLFKVALKAFEDGVKFGRCELKVTI